MSYDSACYDLAALFIGDAAGVERMPEAVIAGACDELAQEIQNTIEDFLREFEGSEL